MDRCGRQHGFSLVEVLVAVVSAAVIALTVCATLVYTVQAWKRHQALVAMQSDVRVAVPAMCDAIREAKASDVVTPALGGTGAQLTMANRSFFRSDSSLNYAATGSYLTYDPNTNAVNDKIALCIGRVTALQYTHGTNSISFHLVLQDQSETMVIDDEVFFRN